MDGITILVIVCAIVLLATFYVVWPLFWNVRRIAPVDDDLLTLLLQRKDTVLRSIKELEFDYNMGKLTDSDYARMNERLRRQATGLLQQIEKITPNIMQLEEQLEEEIFELRQIVDLYSYRERKEKLYNRSAG